MNGKKMLSVEAEGKTINEAIEKGLGELGVGREQVDVKVLHEGSSGLFGLMGSKAAKIKLIVREAGTAAAAVEEGCEEAAAAAGDGKLLSMIEKFTKKTLDLMKFKGTKVSVSSEGIELKVKIKTTDSRDSALLIGKAGKALGSLEVVLQAAANHYVIANKMVPDDKRKPRVVLDVNNYRLREEEKIRDTIAAAIETVKRSKREYKFKPMSPRSRRMVHLAVKDNPELETVSVGEGSDRKVILKPKK